MAAQASETPRVRVAALMFLDGRVVLVRHRGGRSAYHLLPGGGVSYRETLEDALVREVLEETGLEARIVRPVFVSDTIDPKGFRHVINITFLARIVGGQVTSSPQDDRVEAVDLFEPHSLSRLDLRPPMAEAIGALVSEGLETAPARYLGSLFSEPRS